MIVIASWWGRRPRSPGHLARLFQEIPLPFLLTARFSRVPDGGDSDDLRRRVDGPSEGAWATLGVYEAPWEHWRWRRRGGHPRPLNGRQRGHFLHHFRRRAARDATHHAGVLRHIGVDGGRIRWKSTGATCMKTTIMKRNSFGSCSISSELSCKRMRRRCGRMRMIVSLIKQKVEKD